MKEPEKHIVIIGGGPAGIEAAEHLSELGYQISIIEKNTKIGGKLNDWHQLFPDHRPAREVLDHLLDKLPKSIKLYLNSEVTRTTAVNDKYLIEINGDQNIKCNSILITTGFDVFDARLKEEYGYGIYDNVITSADLEYWFKHRHDLTTKQGKSPRKIALINCVGSRDEKVGNLYCSSVCCVTGVKQAIELKQLVPDAEILMFYMDIRMYGRFYEDLYLEAQEKYHVQFIRGRLSELAELQDGSLVLKADDTLAGSPIKVQADIVVLLVGFVPALTSTFLSRMLNIDCAKDGFFAPCDTHTDRNSTGTSGIFMAGACTGPKNLENSMADARSAALKIHKYLVHHEVKNLVDELL
jgi:heterodisulfide reductase subunit A2